MQQLLYTMSCAGLWGSKVHGMWSPLTEITVSLAALQVCVCSVASVVSYSLRRWKRPWCWEKLKAGGEGDDRGWDGWKASPTQWTWIWVCCGSWWWTGRPVMLQFMESQRVGHDWVTELNWTDCFQWFIIFFWILNFFIVYSHNVVMFYLSNYYGSSV